MADTIDAGPASSSDRPGPDASQAEVEADIARTREQLGQTLAQLVEKFDVRARAERTIEEVKDNATHTLDEAGHKVTEKLSAATGAVKSVFSYDDATTSAAAGAGPDTTVEAHVALRSRPDWASLAPLMIASGLALTAVVVAVGWRR